MKKAITLGLLFLCTLLIFGGCNENAAVKCATDYTESVISNDLTKAQKYLSAEADTTIFPQDELLSMVGKAVLKKTTLTEAVLESQKDNAAVVSLTIETPDPSKLMDRATNCALEVYFADTSTSTAALNEYISEEIKADLEMSGLTIAPVTVSVPLVKEDKQWKITEEGKDAISDAVLGDIRAVSLSTLQQ